MIATAILCSGQGAQSATMFDLLADAPAAEPVFAAAKTVLGGTDPRDLVHQASDDAIHADKIAQILCCTQTMAAWTVIGDQLPRPLLVAGYSVGEIAAWGVAGLLDPVGVLRLAKERAAAMDAATTQPSGLAAIRGLTRAALEALCQSHGCSIAIVNAADQMLVGGTNASLASVVHDAIADGAKHAMILPVAVASHTPLLAAASSVFHRTLAASPIRSSLPPGIRLLSGIDGMAVFDVQDGEAKLARQIRQTVDWAACMDSCQSLGVTKVIELGPGSALAHMMRDVIPDADSHSLSEFHSLNGFIQWATR
jgi:[acyl-carrier-protein] S-malonyltransferase